MRFTDWPTRLHHHIEAFKDQKFSYGSFDCGLFAASCIEVLTGEDFASELRGYKSRRESLEAMKRVCGSTSIRKLGEYISTKHNLKSVPVLMAQRGDLAIVKDRRFGIVTLTGTHIYVPAKVGVVQVPLSQATKVYRV